MSIEFAAAYADILVSPQFRSAANETFERSPDTYIEQREIADTIAVSALRKHLGKDHTIWEQRQQAALTEAEGTDLGAFNDYFQRQRGKAPETGRKPEDLEESNHEIVGTNSRILSLHNAYNKNGDPLDFVHAALTVVEERKKQASRSRAQFVGPENYATTLKFFADEMRDFPSQHLSHGLVKEQVDRCMDGFEAIAVRDKPNFIEMTNVYAAIRSLPESTFDAKYTPGILKHSLELLPDFDSGILSVMIASLSKLDLQATGETAATLVDLAIRKGKKFETTTDYLQTLRAIGNLPPSPAANRALATFGEYRNDLEKALDINGCDVANEQFLKIVNDVIDDPELTKALKSLAEYNARHAIQLLRAKQHSGELTKQGLAQLKTTVDRIVANFTKI